MKLHHLAYVLTLALLSSCASIPDRPLDPKEQSLVGIWMADQYVNNVGHVKAVAQLLPDRNATLLVRGNQGMQRKGYQWEVIGNRMHQTSFMGSDEWSSIQLTEGQNTILLDGSNGRITWKRYSHNPYHSLDEALNAIPDNGWNLRPGVPWWADLASGMVNADMKVQRARAAAGDEQARQWVENHQPEVDTMNRSFDNSEREARAARPRFPID